MSDISESYLLYIQVVGKLGGILSCAGSGYILQDVLRDPHKRKESIYHRIMLGLSTMDILSSFFLWFLGSWAMPAGSWSWAAGNVATCDAAAFLGGIGFLGSPLYNCSLAKYYLFQLRDNCSDRRMKVNEKWLHIVPWSISLLRCITTLFTKMYGPYYGVCAISEPYPWGCNNPGSKVECTRGMNSKYLYWSVSYVVLTSCTIYVSISMYAVYKAVRDTERNAQKYSFLAKFQAQNKKRIMKRSRRVMIQGILYSATMVFLYVFGIINITYAFITKKEHLVIQIIFVILPLQGLFNVLIYLVPVFRKKLKAYKLRKGYIKQDAGRCKSMIRIPLPFETIPSVKLEIGETCDNKPKGGEKEEEEEERNRETSAFDSYYPELNIEEGNREEGRNHRRVSFIHYYDNDSDTDCIGIH